jgi:hemerythrin-like domain-containing protein
MLPMTRRAVRKPGPGARRVVAAGSFMRILRDDHAGLSRVLREIDAQTSVLQSVPGAARPVLAEALHYLLVYQHSIHHRREDQLFARVRAREPRLYANMRRLVREHRVGHQQAERIAGELSRATLAQLRGRTGLRLAKQLQQYVQQTRDHMRREEAVFYTGSERVLRASDWAALMAGPMPRDPAADPQRFATRYPRLAERMSRPQRIVTGPRETSSGADLRARAEEVVERCAARLRQAIDVAQCVARAAVRAAGLRPRGARAGGRGPRRASGSRR